MEFFQVPCTRTQQRRQQTKWRHMMMIVAVDWYTNENEGHGSGLENQRGHFWEAFKDAKKNK